MIRPGHAWGIPSRGLQGLFIHAGNDGKTARGPPALFGEFCVHIRYRLAVLTAACLFATPALAGAGQGFGRCKTGFADNTRIRTEARGEMTIGEVRVSDRVWSFNEIVGKPGWSRVLQRIEGGKHYQLLSEFSEPGSSEITKACWRIERAG